MVRRSWSWIIILRVHGNIVTVCIHRVTERRGCTVIDIIIVAMCIKCCCCHICPGGRRRGRPGRAVELELLHCISNTIDASCPPIVTVFLPLEWHSTQADHTCIIYIYIYLYVHSVTHAHIDLLLSWLPWHATCLHIFIHLFILVWTPPRPIAPSPPVLQSYGRETCRS